MTKPFRSNLHFIASACDAAMYEARRAGGNQVVTIRRPCPAREVAGDASAGEWIGRAAVLRGP